MFRHLWKILMIIIMIFLMKMQDEKVIKSKKIQCDKKGCQKMIFALWYLLARNFISLLYLKSSTFKKYTKSFCDKMIVLYEGCKSLLRTWHYSLTTLVYHILYSHFYQHPYHCCNWLFWGSYLYILSHKMYCCLY